MYLAVFELRAALRSLTFWVIPVYFSLTFAYQLHNSRDILVTVQSLGNPEMASGGYGWWAVGKAASVVSRFWLLN
ncbi:MAG: hypothetical protein ACREJQ_05405, partial [bacterium]